MAANGVGDDLEAEADGEAGDVVRARCVVGWTYFEQRPQMG